MDTEMKACKKHALVEPSTERKAGAEDFHGIVDMVTPRRRRQRQS
jgi:hypothetical protein